MTRADPIRAALERLIAALGDYEPIWGCFPESALATARAALAEQQGEGPSDEELCDLWIWAAAQDHGPWPTQQHCFARAVLARWGHQPAPPADGEVAELVEWLHDCADVRMDEGYEDPAFKFARAAELLQQQHPTPVPVSERLPGPEEMDGSLVWCGSQAAGLPYWEWCLDDIRHPCSSGYTHWLPANTPALPTALPLPQGEVE